MTSARRRKRSRMCVESLSVGGKFPMLPQPNWSPVSLNSSWMSVRKFRDRLLNSLMHMTEWEQFANQQHRLRDQQQNSLPNAKLICIDLQPYGSTQAPEGGNILNVGGFSDVVIRSCRLVPQSQRRPLRQRSRSCRIANTQREPTENLTCVVQVCGLINSPYKRPSVSLVSKPTSLRLTAFRHFICGSFVAFRSSDLSGSHDWPELPQTLKVLSFPQLP